MDEQTTLDQEVTADVPLSAESMFSNISSLLDLGGPVVAILIALSVIALAMILLKLWQFTRDGVGSQSDVSAALSAWEQGEQHEARRIAGAARGPAADLLSNAMRALANHWPTI